MGLLRLVLAFSVMNVHTNMLPWSPIGGDTAVQMFFVISGYYMAMVLNEKYLPAKSTNLDFWKSRVLRIFPAYCAVLVATLIAARVFAAFPAGFMQPADAWRQMLQMNVSRIYLVLSGLAQVTLLGLDVANFTAITPDGQVSLTADAWSENFPAWRSVFVPQAWTLSLELYFYLLAPLLLRRRAALLLWILTASLALRIVAAVFLGYRSDPWSYRFFPFELLFFLAGAIAYRLGKVPDQPPAIGASMRGLVMIMVFSAALIGRFRVPGQSLLLAPALPALLFLCIGRLFELTRHSRIDRMLGELSYPLYLCHVLIIWIVVGFFPHAAGWRRLVAPALSIAAAGLIYICIDKPVDERRHRRFGL